MVLTQGEVDDQLHILYYGKAEVFYKDKVADESHLFSLAELSSGDFFGERGFISRGASSASVKTKENCSVLSVCVSQIKEKPYYSLLLEKLAELQVDRLGKANHQQISTLRSLVEKQKEQISFGQFYIATIVLFALASVIPDYSNESPAIQLFSRWFYLFLLLVPAIYVLKYQQAPLKTFGLTLDNWFTCMKEGCAIAVIILPVLVLVKILTAPADQSLFSWDTMTHYSKIQIIFYVFTYLPHAAIQEFIARGVGQGSLQRFMSGAHHMKPILIASSLFAILHLHLSLNAAMMTFVISVLFGYLFYRHRSLVGVIFLHFIMGIFATALGLI